MKPKYTFVRYRVSRRCFVPGILAISIALALSVKPARAASGDWNVDAAGSWSLGTNWTSNPTIPGSAVGDVINFANNISAARAITLDGARIVGDLNIGDSTTGFFGYTFSAGTGGSLTLDVASGSASIDFLNAGANAAANTISNGITINDAVVIRSNNSLAQTFGGAITDGAATLGLTFNNDVNGTVNAAASAQGQFILSVANTYDGGTAISDVRVQGGNATSFGTGAVSITGAGQAYLISGTVANSFNLNSTGWVEGAGNLGALRIEGATVSGTVNMQRDSQIGVNSGTGTISGVLGGAFNFTKIRGAQLVLSGNNTFSGYTTVNDGQLSFSSVGAMGNSPAVIVENPANPAAADTNTLQLAGGITLGTGRTVVLRNNSTSNIANARTAFENTSGNNTWLGAIVLDGGANQTLTSAAGTFTVAGNVSQSASPSTSMFIRGNGAGVVTGSLNLGSGQLFKTDGGAWTISSTGNSHGAVTVANGNLIINATNALNTGSTLTLGEGNGNNGRLTINTGFTQSFAVIGTTSAGGSAGSHTIDGGGSLDVGAPGRVITVNDSTAANDLTITANIIGSGGITKAGAGNLVLNNTTSGPVALSAGTLSGSPTLSALSTAAGTTLAPGNFSSAGTITTSTLSLSSGTIAVDLGSVGSDLINVTASGGLTQTGTTTISISPNGSINTASTFYPILAYSGTSPGTAGFVLGSLPPRVAGSITDSGSAIGITATNDKVKWTGTTNGTWDINTTQNWQTVAGAAATNYLQGDDLVFTDTGANTSITLGVAVSPAAVDFQNTSGGPAYTIGGAGSLTGIMAFIKSGTGLVTLGGTAAHTYTGATTVSAGTLAVNAATSSLTNTSGVSVSSGATLRLFSANADFTFNRTLSGSGIVELDANAGGTAGIRGVTLNGTSAGFSGTLRLSASGTLAANGSFRLNCNQAAIGTANVIANERTQFWPAGTVTNNVTITGYGYQEAAGGTATATATAADASSLTVPSGTYAGSSGVGAIRLDSAAINGNITLVGDSKVMAYNSTGTIGGNITNSASTDDLVLGGGTAGTNIVLTGDNSGLERIWVNGGGTTGTNTLVIGNNTASGTLGTGDVVLYQDGAAAGVRFQRTDGYSLAAGQNIVAARDATAANLSKAFVHVNTTGSGLTIGGLGTNVLDLSDGTNGANISVGNNLTGSVLNIASGATVRARSFYIGDQTGFSATANQTGGSVALNGINTDGNQNLRLGHWPSETSVYNISAGSISFSSAAPATTPSSTTELAGGIYVGIDGQGIFNQSGGTVTTNWVVLDNRGDTVAGTNMTGLDQYNLTGGALELKSAYGLIGRNPTTIVNFGGGTVRNTAADTTDVALNSVINTTAATTTTLDTVNATRKFSLMNNVTGTGTITLSGGGNLNLNPDSNATRTGTSTGSGTQSISAIIAGSNPVVKVGSGTTTLSGINTYSGTTSVNAGRLNLTGSAASSAVTVANAASLGGEGTVASLNFGTPASVTDVTNLFVDGSTAGALTSTGTLTVNGPATAAVNVNVTAPPTGPGTITVLNHGGTTATAAQFSLVNASSFRNSTFTVGATNVTLAFTNKDLVWDGSTATWEIGGSDNDWNGPTNDNFFTGDNVTFDDSLISGDQSITMSGALIPGNITVNNTTYKYTLTGSGFGGVGGLTKIGDFDLDLGGTNTFTGPISISGGIVKTTTAGALGSGPAGITISGSGTLDLGAVAANTINLGSKVVTISGTGVGGTYGAITQTGANDQQNAFQFVTLAGDATISGSGRYDIRGTSSVLDLAGFTLTKTGSNKVYGTVDGTITQGNIEVNAGTFGVWNGTVGGTGYLKANSLGNVELSSMVAGKFSRQVILNGGILSSTAAATTSGGVSYTAPSTITNTADLVLSGSITETGGPFNLVKTGAGTLILTGTNGLTGKVDVSAGILRVPTDTLLGPVPGSPVADSITLQLGGRIQGGNATVGNDLTLDPNRGISLPNGDGGLHVWSGFTMNCGGSVTGVGNFTKTDGGTLNFTGTASHLGTTSLSSGITNFNGAVINATSSLRVGANASTGLTTLNINSGTITTQRCILGDQSNNSSLVNQTGGTVNITGTNSNNDNTASFLFGHWGGGNNSTYNLSGGTLNSVGAELSLGWDTTTSVFNQTGGTANLLGIDLGNGRSNLAIYSLQGGRLNLGANGITANTNKMVNLGGGTLGAYANWSAAQPLVLTGNGTTTVNTLDSVDNLTERTVTFNGAVSGLGGLVKDGGGTLVLSATNTFTGNTTVNAGTLSLNGGGGVNGTIRGTVTMNAGTLLRLNSGDVTGYDATTRLGVINLNGATMNVAVTSNQTLGNGVINMTGAAITGVAASNLDFFQTSSALNTLASSTSSTISGVQLSIRQTAGLTVTVASGTVPGGLDLDVSSVIASNGTFAAAPLIKAGPGTLNLTAANLHTGGTNVNAGKLLVNNTTGSGTGTGAVTVAATGTLGGGGTLSGATTVSGTLAPGNSVGTLNFGSTLNLQAGSSYAVEINGAASNDKVNVTGALTANGTIKVTLVGYTPVAGNTFDIADASGISGSPTFDFSAATLTAGLVWDTSTFASTGVIQVVTSDPYDAWATLNNVTGGKAGDDDGDGVLNILEFATNSDAKSASSGARAYPKMHVLGGENVLTYTVAVRKSAVFAAGSPDASKQEAIKDKVKYVIEASNEVGVWNTVVVSELNPTDSAAVQSAMTPALPGLGVDWEWHSFRTDGGAPTDPTDFIRLKVEEAP